MEGVTEPREGAFRAGDGRRNRKEVGIQNSWNEQMTSLERVSWLPR